MSNENKNFYAGLAEWLSLMAAVIGSFIFVLHRFEVVENRLENRFQLMENRFDRMEAKWEQRTQEMTARTDKLYEMFYEVVKANKEK